MQPQAVTPELPLPAPTDLNLFEADAETLTQFKRLPENICEARRIAENSDFILANIPEAIIRIYCGE